MKMKQIKEFTTETVTQEIAIKICCIMIWNNFDKPEYKDRFKITDKNGEGILIITPLDHRVRIFKHGGINASKGDTSMHMNTQIPLVQLYLTEGFYTIE